MFLEKYPQNSISTLNNKAEEVFLYMRNMDQLRDERRTAVDNILEKKHTENLTMDRLLITVQKERTNWKLLTTIEDWKKYYSEHLEWHRLTTGEMQKDKNGGQAFYQAFSTWCRNESNGDETKRKELIVSLFPASYNNWRLLTTIEDWKKYYSEHPEWQGLTMSTIRNNDEGSKFYYSFCDFCKIESRGDKLKTRNLIESIFQGNNTSWKDFRTKEQWKVCFDDHPEWQGLTSSGIEKTKNGKKFYQAFSTWSKKESGGDEIKRKELMQFIFPIRYTSWENLRTKEQWKACFDEHPEWYGFTIGEMQKDKNGGQAFYQAFSTWCRNESNGSSSLRNAIVATLFPRRKKYEYCLSDNDMIHYFDSYPERIIALILYELGMIQKFEEDKNIHILTNGKKRNSVDFKVGDILLEYHPLSVGERKKGMKFTDTAGKKHNAITNPKFKNRVNLYVFDEIDTLFEIIKNDRELRFYIRNPTFGVKFEKDDWDEIVKSAYKRVLEYDIKNKQEHNGNI